jgi:hypothetical protein
MNTHKIFTGAVAIVASLALATAPITFGQSSSVETYGGQGGNIASSVKGGAPGATHAAAPSSSAGAGGLPFTGLDVALLVGGGMILLLLGLGMARMARRTELSDGS